MANVDKVRLEGDSSGIVKAVDNAAGAFNKYDKTIDKTTVTSKRLTEITKKAEAIIARHNHVVELASQRQRALDNWLRRTGRSIQSTSDYTSRLSEANIRAAHSVRRNLEALRRLRERANEANSGVKSMTLSLGGMAKLVASRVITASFFKIVNSIREGVSESIELQRGIAEVRTISQEAQLTTSEWLSSIKEVSSAFGVDLKDQIEAVYQTLSNQVAKGADSVAFLAAANKLATTTASSTADAVKLLTSVINSYGLEASSADDVSAKLFKAVELGRLRVGELGNSFGEVSVLAAQLNINLDELLSMLVNTTIKGLPTSKALTQIRGIFLGLIKPTEAMSALYKKLDVSSGEMLIRQMGLVGALKAVVAETDGTSDAVAKLFPRVRGLSGALTLLESNGENAAATIEKLKNATKSYDDAAKDMAESTPKRWDVLFESTKNVFRSVWEGITEGIVTNVEYYSNFFEKSEEERQKLLEKSKRNRLSDINELFKSFQSATQGRTDLLKGEIIASNKAYDALREKIVETYSIQLESAEKAHKGILNSTESMVARSKEIITNLSKNIVDNNNRIVSIIQTEDETLFKWAQDTRNTAEKIAAITERITELQAKQAKAFTEGNQKAFDDYSEHIRRLTIERRQLDMQLSDDNKRALEEQKKLAESLAKIRRDAIVKEAELRKKLHGAKRGDRGTIEKQIFELNKDTAQKVAEIQSKISQIEILDSKRVDHHRELKKLNEAEIQYRKELIKRQEEQAKKEEALLLKRELHRDKLKTLFQKFGDFDLSESLKGDSSVTLRKDAAERQKIISELIAQGKGLGLDMSEFEDIEKAISVETKALIERAIQLEKQEEATRRLAEANRELEQTAIKLADAERESLKVEQALQEFKDLNLDARGLGGKQGRIFEVSEINKVLENISRLMDSGNLDDYRKIISEVQKLNVRNSDYTFDDFDKFAEAARKLAQVINQVEREGSFLDSVVLKEANADYNKLKDVVESIKKENEKSKEALDDQNRTILNNVIPSVDELLRDQNEIYRTIRQQTIELEKQAAISSRGTGEPVTQAFGDIARGSDNMLALRQAGEAVINPVATRKMFSQLVAMNSAPQSAVIAPNNTTYGSVNVTMNASNPSYDIVALANQIDKARRRGLIG